MKFTIIMWEDKATRPLNGKFLLSLGGETQARVTEHKGRHMKRWTRWTRGTTHLNRKKKKNEVEKRFEEDHTRVT